MRIAALLLVLSLGACVATPPYPSVPALRADPMPKPPFTAEQLLWQPGHWDWSGSGYVWAPGQYVPAAGHGGSWMPGWWSRVDGIWRWEPAHWVAG